MNCPQCKQKVYLLLDSLLDFPRGQAILRQDTGNADLNQNVSILHGFLSKG